MRVEKNMLDKVYSIGDNFETEVQKTSADLYYLVTEIAKDLYNQEYEEPIEMKRMLDDELITKIPTDMKSYNLGKAHTIIELMTWIAKFEREKEIGKILTAKEKIVLEIICKNKEILFSELIEKTNLEKEILKEAILSLKRFELIYESKIGMYVWYRFSVSGNHVMENIINEGKR